VPFDFDELLAEKRAYGRWWPNASSPRMGLGANVGQIQLGEMCDTSMWTQWCCTRVHFETDRKSQIQAQLRLPWLVRSVRMPRT
jgi:hypothetical protein